MYQIMKYGLVLSSRRYEYLHMFFAVYYCLSFYLLRNQLQLSPVVVF
jgi:hypothetical protein